VALKPEMSLGVGLATAAVVYGVYQNATPTIADIRAGAPGDEVIDGTRKMAAWTAAAVVAGISLIARDPTVFIVGGTMVVAVDWWHRHANEYNPDTGRATLPRQATAGQDIEDPSAGGMA
jgi:hypothetical protein